MLYPLKNWKKIKRGYKFGEKTFYSAFHLGTDYIIPEGTPVYAPMSCEIVEAGNFPAGGNTIFVKIRNRKYGPLVMRLMHLSKMSLLGKYKAGEILGRTGNTGKLTRGPHLHIDLSRESVDTKNLSNFIDPEIFFSSAAHPKKLETKTKNKNMYSLYILECADKTLYTGITTNLKRRITEHNGAKLGSKYTSSRRPVKLVYSQKFKNRSSASKSEARIKRLNKNQKLELIGKSKKN